MPGLVFLNRRWNIASDDLFYPGLIELISRSLWLSPQLFFYIKYKEYYNCPETDLLHTYYIGFLCTMTLIIFVQFWIVNISSRGTIADSRPRRPMVKFLYLRTFLVILELAWSVVGTIWLANVKIKECSLIVYYTVLANLIFCGIAVFFMFIVIFIVFDPLSHLDENDIQKKRNILNYLLNKMCCCFYCCLHTGNSRQANYENSYKQISALLEMIFRNGDLTPSDIAAGIILINNKEVDQFKRESKLNRSKTQANLRHSLIQVEKIPRWMDINAASYYVKYALATYSWPYYLYMHNIRGFCDICCICSPTNSNSDVGICGCCTCCSGRSTITIEPASEDVIEAGSSPGCIIHGDTRTRRNLRAFKFLSKTEDCDIVYASFTNELFLVPFCVIVDHYKKSVIITIRGTLSMRDVITDMTADCGYFDVGNLEDEPVHDGILNTAENIYQIIKKYNLLPEAFRKNPNYQLMVTGHSLGAGTATILALKLKNEYPDIRCIAYSPPGGLVSEALSDYTKSFVMSVVVGDDIVPRLSVHSVHNLKANILKEIYQTKLPKYKIIWKYSVSLASPNPSEIVPYDSPEESEDENLSQIVSVSATASNAGPSASEDMQVTKVYNLNAVRSIPDEDECALTGDTGDTTNLFQATSSAINREAKKVRREASKSIRRDTNLVEIEDFKEENDTINSQAMANDLIKKMKRHVKETYPRLVLPGNILYIYQIDSITKRSCCSSLCSSIFCCCASKSLIDYDSRWAHRSEFKKILITNRMLLDHFPNQVDGALDYFASTRRYI